MIKTKTLLLKLGIMQFSLLMSSFSFSQTYPNSANNANTPSPLSGKDSLTKTNNSTANSQQSTSNKTQNDNRKPSHNVIVTYPMNSTGGAPPQSIQNTGLAASNKLQSLKPISPGFDTTSSSGGPTNNQDSINYGSNGSIKIQGSR